MINRILQIWSIILWWLYYAILYNTNLDDLSYSESLLYVWIIPLALLGIPLIIALLHKKTASKIRFSWTSLFIAIVFGWIAWSIVRWWISGALASIEALFDVDIDSELYADIWIISEILLAGSFVFNYYLTLTFDSIKKVLIKCETMIDSLIKKIINNKKESSIYSETLSTDEKSEDISRIELLNATSGINLR